MDADRIEIGAITAQLMAYTARSTGIAVLAHSDAGSADLFLDGDYHKDVFTGLTVPGETVVRLRARQAKFYLFFELLSPMPPELLTQMGEKYNRLIQARFSPAEMLEMMRE